MEFQRVATLAIFVLQFLDVSGLHHLVYWDKTLIPALSQEGLEITLEVNDWMDVLCPYYANMDIPPHHDTRTDNLVIYNVTESEFRNCDVRRGKRLQMCDDPSTEKKLTTKFQERSPSPFGFKFKPGSTYYYVSKTRQEGSSRGCTRDTLRMMINVRRKGTVLISGDPQTTKTYHEQEIESSTEPPTTSTTTELLEQVRKHKRHHHHDRATKSVTSTPQPVANARFDSHETKVRQIQEDDPGNAGHGSLHMSKFTTSVLLVISSAIALASNLS